MPHLYSQPRHYMDLLKINKKNFVAILSDNDMLGIEESRFDFKRLYRATVLSDKVYFYSLPLTKLNKMIENEFIQEEYSSYSISKLANFVNRISEIRNGSMIHIDNEH